MLEFDEYKVKLNNLRPALDELDQALDLDAAEREIDMLQAESAADGFWDNLEKAQKVQQRLKRLQDKVDAQAKRKGRWEDLMTLCELGNEEEDASLVPELEEGFAELEGEMEQILRQGYAIENGELRIGLRSVAAPVFNVAGEAAYAVCVVGMFRRVNSPELERATKLLLDAAERISFELGYRGPLHP